MTSSILVQDSYTFAGTEVSPQDMNDAVCKIGISFDENSDSKDLLELVPLVPSLLFMVTISH